MHNLIKFFFAIKENVIPAEVERYEMEVRMQNAKIIPPITGPQLIISFSDKRIFKPSIISTQSATKRNEKGMKMIRPNDSTESGLTIESPSP